MERSRDDMDRHGETTAGVDQDQRPPLHQDGHGNQQTEEAGTAGRAHKSGGINRPADLYDIFHPLSEAHQMADRAGVLRSLLCITMAQDVYSAHPAPGLEEQDSLKSAQFWYAALAPDCASNHAGQKRLPASEQLCEPRQSLQEARRGSTRADGAGSLSECMSLNSPFAEDALSSQWHFQVWPQPVFKLQTDALEDDATSPCFTIGA